MSESLEGSYPWPKIALVAGLGVWTLWFARTPLSADVNESFLHLPNLVFHEAGHVIFSPFGRFMTVLGGFASFFGPIVGAFTFIFLKSELMGLTQYWRFWLGVTLAVIVIAFPRGLMGLAKDAWQRLAAKR